MADAEKNKAATASPATASSGPAMTEAKARQQEEAAAAAETRTAAAEELEATTTVILQSHFPTVRFIDSEGVEVLSTGTVVPLENEGRIKAEAKELGVKVTRVRGSLNDPTEKES